MQWSARYDAAGRVVERGDTQYRYDECGRLVEKRTLRAGFRVKETRYEWDVQDRLVRVLLPGGERWRYRYDAFGRRVSKVREGQVPSAQAVARVSYRWDGDQLIGQQQYRADGSAAREVQWVYEPGSFRPLAQVESKEGTTRLHYIVTDLTGTARELCSESGQVHWRGEQGLWGAHREDKIPLPLRRYLGDAANEEVYCDLRYQGQIYDTETGLYYNRHRYYDAEGIQQYISPDPIGLHGGIRPQSYVTNPLEFCDPLGLARSVCQARYERYKDYRSQGYSAEEAAKLSKGANPATITPGSLPAAEEAAVNRTLGHIDNGDKPAGALGRKWGTTFKNHQGELPGGSGANSPYREYRVDPGPGVSGAGARRVVVNSNTGETYYTWTHYGDSGNPSFVRIR